jgi:hypothetical protein
LESLRQEISEIPRSHCVELEAVRSGDELPGVLVVHGEPLHTRVDFEAALDRDP